MEYYFKEEKNTDENGNIYISYSVGNDDFYIHDVFISKRKAEKFVRLCNRLKLSPIHLKDVIEDFIQK